MQVSEGCAYHHAVMAVSYSEADVVGKKHVVDAGIGNEVYRFASLFPWASPNVDAGRYADSHRWVHDLGAIIRQVP